MVIIMNKIVIGQYDICQKIPEYSEEHDAYFCTKCNIWITAKCDEKACAYCFNRPEKPIQD